MRRFRIVLYVVGALVVLGGLGGIAAFWFTGGAVAAANDFFRTIAERGPEEAYKAAAPSFHDSGTAAEFGAVVARFGLRRFKAASWSSRSISGSTAELEGVLTLSDGGAVPVTTRLVKNGSGAWQVFGIDTVRPGVGTTPPTPTARPALPSEAELRQRAKVTMQQLAEAINSGDFRGIQLSGSRAFRQQKSAEDVKAIFKPFSDAHVDLTQAFRADPVFDPAPEVNGDGVLVLKGNFPTERQPWYFDFEYLFEDGDWRLITISVSSRPG